MINSVDYRLTLCYMIGMAKTENVGVRFTPEERLALDAWAEAARRPISWLIHEETVKALYAQGWLRDRGALLKA
jgi:hypothetical protein